MSISLPDLCNLPEMVQQPLTMAWQSYQENSTRAGLEPLDDRALLTDVAHVWGASNFVATSLARHPELLQQLSQGGLQTSYANDEIKHKVLDELNGSHDPTDLGRRLRIIRRREMVRITWRDISGRAGLDETLRDLSDLADACIDGALEPLYQWLCESLGTPCNDDGVPQRLVVLGMGKLGGRELNFSSDIDLIFAFAENGSTRDGKRTIDNAQFFQRLGQQLIAALDPVTAEGFVFRTDMRLRPNGSVGPLAISFDAMEQYYQHQGRNWERYAMVKARVVAGDRERGAELLKMLRPFVYRRYLDFGAIESLRELKQTIRAEMRRKSMENNIKLGDGGIREVEFVVQAQQIIHAGRDPQLRQRNLLEALTLLGDRQLLPRHTVKHLQAAYRFLRKLENRIQQIDDRQLQVLPETPLDQARLVLGMGADSWSALGMELGRVRAWVADAFEQVFAAPQRGTMNSDDSDNPGGVWALLPLDNPKPIQQRLAMAGFGTAGSDSYRKLLAFQQHHELRVMDNTARNRINQLMPLLINAAAASQTPDATLHRLLDIIESIGRRSAYLGLLIENPLALGQLARLCAASAWIATHMARHPLLLDELIDPRSLFNPPGRTELQHELDVILAALDLHNQEAVMEVLRRFQITNQLRIAAADVTRAIPLMVVSDHLTALAEVTLGAVLAAAWQQLTQRYGRPPQQPGSDTGFAIIGYGKLGGIEFGYGSDLDIIFLHNATPASVTDGDKPIDSSLFYSRLVQRIVHILSTPTGSGRLYETDLRLRPSGASGLLVTSIDAMKSYQQQQAWTWEHQALVHARPVAGDPVIATAFMEIRSMVLSQPRDARTLRQEVREMRTRMRAHLGTHDPDQFHLKQDRGGIADIEFLVQYGVLRWVHEFPALLAWSDNIRLLDGFADAGLLSREHADALADAYRVLRAEIHRLKLAGRPTIVPADAFQAQRDSVNRCWQVWLEESAGEPP